jgi:RNA-directed DNA polymerase
MHSFVKNLEDLALHTDVPFTDVFRMVKNAGSYYRTFRLPKKSGGYRKISAPTAALKVVQKWIANKLLPPDLVHDSATGYRKGMGILHNAQPHTNRDWVYNVDLEQFFPSVRANRVEQLLEELGFNRKFAAELTALLTLNNELPQGAPSSPVLANLVCRSLDLRLSSLAQKRGWSYTRYCDDITLSGSGRIFTRDENLVRRIIADEGFRVNPTKVRINRQNSRQTVTGLVVNRFANIERQTRRRVRAMLHQYKQARGMTENDDACDLQFANGRRLLGYISYLRMVRGHDESLSLQ